VAACIKLVLLPFLTYKKYCRLLPQLKYKTFIHDFVPLGSNVRRMMKKDSDKYGDPVRSFKIVYPNFDVCIGNVFSQPLL
jgi:hypothetical protein